MTKFLIVDDTEKNCVYHNKDVNMLVQREKKKPNSYRQEYRFAM